MESPPSSTESEVDASADPEIVVAENECSGSDSSGASATIDQIIQKSTSVEKLHICLYNAVQAEDIVLSRKLLGLGVPISTSTISTAIRQKSLELMSLLFEYGWDVNERIDALCPGPLCRAVEEDADESVVKWFLAHGADPDKMCSVDTTPFSTAVQYAPVPNLELLFRHTSHPQHGELLHHAALRTSDDYGEVMKLVLDRCGGDNVNQIIFEDHAFSFAMFQITRLGTPLHDAARRGRAETARVLLEHGADVTVLDSDGQTALSRAEMAGNHAVLEVLRCPSKGTKDDVGESQLTSLHREQKL